MGMNPALIIHMPIGELSEIVDCNLILNGYCDEYLASDDAYVNIDLE